MTTILLLNGPNLSQLGRRDPDQYGSDTLADIVGRVEDRGRELGVEVEHLQSESEADLVTRVHAALDDGTSGVVLNGGALTHYSIALRDAVDLLPAEIPVVEVHLSNIHARERFRHESLTAGVADGVIAGLGGLGYVLALEACVRLLTDRARHGGRG